jgi:3D (Asp-Asp-Asp) domain-containing protein
LTHEAKTIDKTEEKWYKKASPICLAILFMTLISQKIAYSVLLGLVSLNPQPMALVNSLGNGIVTPAQAAVAGDKNLENGLNGLVPAGPATARYTTVRLVTAYSSTVDQCDDTPFITANGTHVRDGIVAANWLKFNTRIRIPEVYGDKVFIVTDRMNPRFDDRLDIWMETREEAVKFGLKKLTIEVL